ncbi:MAG: zinc ABC transporter substrate-binding protein [Chlamydiales bacterium]|nr:zinc ABC transporter substrate-binding protein [Chlamydiales bacterium]
MKKTLFLLCFSLCCLLFVGCSKKQTSSLNEWMKDDGKLKILSTTSIVGDLVSMIGGGEIDPLVLIKGEIDPHSYELVKGDAEKIARADIIFSNGLGLEHGASLVFAITHHKNHLPIGNKLLNSSIVLEVDGQIDPHVWMDASLWKELVDPIVDKLTQVSPAKKDIFAQRGEIVKKQLELLDKEVLATIHTIPAEKRYLVTSHDAFNYFARRYLKDVNDGDHWQERFSAPEGLAPDGQLSIKNIDAIIQHLKRYHIQVLFPESNVSKDSLKKILEVARQKHIDVNIVKTPLYGDTLGEKGSGADTYIQMMQYNSHNIAIHLAGKQ